MLMNRGIELDTVLSIAPNTDSSLKYNELDNTSKEFISMKFKVVNVK